MANRVVEIAKDIHSPATAAAFTRTLTGKTMGPCDYLVLSINSYMDENNTGTPTDTGLNNGVDYVQVSLNSSKSGNQGDEGKVLYKFFGGSTTTDSATQTGVINEVMRMLWRMNCGMKGLGTWTKDAAADLGVVYRLPLFKNEPVEVAVEISMLVATWYSATGVLAYTTWTASLKAHIVDECEDMKFATYSTAGASGNFEMSPINIPDRPGYFLLGYVIQAYDNSTAADAELLGGLGTSTDNTDTKGWVQVRNSDGQVFDYADGQTLKTDNTALAGPHELYAAARLWSDSLYGLGMYARLMASPIEAKSLQLILFPNAIAAAADRFRVWFFYVTQKGRQVDTNRTRANATQTGPDGAVAK
jgi:hypothetical protein